MHHWVPLLDRCDEYFERHLKDRRDLTLAFGGGDAAGGAQQQQQPAVGGGGSSSGGGGGGRGPDPPFPSQAVLQILRATTLILEGCSNKHLYNSYEVSQGVLPVAALRLAVAGEPGEAACRCAEAVAASAVCRRA